ncbi:MAG: TIGR03960 family B12-binding radical SAM protein [Desulfobacteraceae bacterium]|nr:MAG: TIGR03960 family B12-binding radical SAM protein [Desulfobacteraceae bacterium]
MQKKIRDILPLVEKPSRYLGDEINSVKKDADAVKLRVALAFPDVYEIGMSHFGLQILYHILNSHDGIAAERVYAPGLDLAAHLTSASVPLSSLETETPLSAFDIIGFSLLYEMNYTNVLMMLDLAGIPFYSSERDASQPLVIAGGPCTVNPEPVADFFDAMVVGDGETVIVEMTAAWMRWKDSGKTDKLSLLTAWAGIEGVFVPSFFQPVYDGAVFKGVQPLLAGYTQVRRAVLPDLNAAAFPDAPIVPYGRPVHDRLRLEIARGCSRGCRFCQAGMIYRPVRERSADLLLELTEKSLIATGYEDISLLSLSTGDYSCLSSLMHGLMQRHASDNIALSLPSFRAGTLSPELMNLVRQVRKTGFTIAPEAGSERLRAVINKNISEKEIVDTISSAFELGWKLIKLYFMVGLPTETESDRYAIVDLVKRIRKNVKQPRGRGAAITVSIGTFIPKSHAPFQWAPQVSLAQSQEMIATLKRQLRIPGVDFKWQHPEVSLMEGLWARGDRRLSHLLSIAYRKGCCFDGWSDHFNFSLWQEAMTEAGVDIDDYTTRKRAVHEPLPWDHINTRVSREFLAAEYEKAQAGDPTPDCRFEECQGCGVCDFETILPVTSPPRTCLDSSSSENLNKSPEKADGTDESRWQVFYAKRGPARYFGHLELVNIFIRACNRSGLQLKFSEGFHPKPKISFHDPLPVGVESEEESFFMTLRSAADPGTILSGLNFRLPGGLSIIDCRQTDAHAGPEPFETGSFMVSVFGGEFSLEQIQVFQEAVDWPYKKTSKKGRNRQINLKDAVAGLERLDLSHLRIQLKNIQKMNVRPGEAIRSIFHFSDEVMNRAEILKEKPANASEIPSII